MAKDKDFERLTHKDRLGNQPVQEAYKAMMTNIVKGLDEIFNGPKTGDDRETGFVLLVFPYGDREGRTNYMSNGANRADVVRMFEEQIRRFRTDRDDDNLYLDQAAGIIRSTIGTEVVEHDMARAAAEACLILYRAGPEAFAAHTAGKSS